MIVTDGQSITLDKDVRTFLRVDSGTEVFLSNRRQKWLCMGESIVVSGPRTMKYQKQDLDVVQVLGENPERFIILDELERNPVHVKPPFRGERFEYGHQYLWHESIGFWYNPVGKPVSIFPPSDERDNWWVVVPELRKFDNLRGFDAEPRAFAVAAGYITQTD